MPTQDSMVHDHSWAIAHALMECLGNCFREEERHDAFTAIYERVKAGLEHYEIQRDRRHKRIHPSSN